MKPLSNLDHSLTFFTPGSNGNGNVPGAVWLGQWRENSGFTPLIKLPGKLTHEQAETLVIDMIATSRLSIYLKGWHKGHDNAQTTQATSIPSCPPDVLKALEREVKFCSGPETERERNLRALLAKYKA